MMGKNRTIKFFLLFTLLIMASYVAYAMFMPSGLSMKEKCPIYYEDRKKYDDIWFGPGRSDIPSFVDCRKNLVVEKIRASFAPEGKYQYVVENYEEYLKDPVGWPEAIVYADKEERFYFDEYKLYVYSDYEKIAYYVVDNVTGVVDKEYSTLDQANESERKIFDKLDN